MELRPLVRKGEEETQFSMFGTDRIIKDFSLEIYPLSERNNRQAGCTAWGCLAQPADIDFPDIDLPDCICFSLFVTPEVFAHYAEKISTAQIDRAVFRLVGVFGCYAEWSPIISTDFVKVLTANSEHKVDLPNNYSEDILRLGRVAEAHLHLSRTLSFANAATGKEAEAEPKNDASRELSFDSNTYNNSSQEPHRQLLNTLTSLRKAVWLAVSMLCLWMVVRLFFN